MDPIYLSNIVANIVSEQKNMEDLNSMAILSCPVGDVGGQKCHMGPKAFQRLELKLGQCVLIAHKDKTFICKAWLRRDKHDGYIDFDTCVYHINCTKNSVTSHGNFVDIKDISTKSVSHLKSIDVEIITNSCESICKFRNENPVIKDLLFQYLDSKVIGTNFLIENDSKSVIHSIKVIKTVPENTYGFVTNSSNILLTNIISLDRYEALNTPPPVLGGLSRELNLLKRMIDVPLLQSELIKNMCSSCPKSVLLRGPPGCGKTTLAQRVARECNAVIVSVTGPDVVGSRPGETEENLKKLYRKAQVHSQEGPTVMFFDELDSFCGKKNTDRRVLSQLASILDQVCMCMNIT